MKLEPVYLVAPMPVPPAVSTRRAFLMTGTAFVFGVGLGGACGYAAGAESPTASAGPAGSPAADPLLEGDAVLRELRRLAVDAPVEELFARRMIFLDLLSRRYGNDEVLWRGVARLCDEVLGNREMQGRGAFAGWLATVIRNGESKFAAALRPRIAELRLVK